MGEAFLCRNGYNNNSGGGIKIQTGSYIGTGEFGPTAKNSLTFDFSPFAVCIEGMWGTPNSYGYTSGLLIAGFNLYIPFNTTGISCKVYTSLDGNTFSWWSYNDSYSSNLAKYDGAQQANMKGETYNWIAFGT